ncbi:hypothetical protein HDU76_000728 [Blyttiomyces sp. JEL0837]|nr:hypothetical protein HDU76_000728 [Blyttiomyces sp. JEL0837]
MVLYKIVIHTSGDHCYCPVKVHETTHVGQYCFGYGKCHQTSTVTYKCCTQSVPAPQEITTFYHECNDGPKEISGIITQVLMTFQDDMLPNRTERLLKDMRSKFQSRPDLFTTLGDSIVPSDSVAIRCHTCPHIKLEMIFGTTCSVSFITATNTDILTVGTSNFAMWGTGVVENVQLTKKFEKFVQDDGIDGNDAPSLPRAFKITFGT